MKKAIKTRWINALRSGKYRQGRWRLKQDDSFCCLGVLCDLYINSKAGKLNNAEWQEDWFVVDERIEDVLLPDEVIEWAGIPHNNPDLGRTSCTGANDGRGAHRRYSFAEISDKIERYL